MLASHKGEIPFAVYLIPFLTGIALAVNNHLSAWQTTLNILFGVMIAAFIALNLFYKKLRVYRKPWVGGLLVHSLLLVTGLLCAIKYDQRNAPDYFAKLKADALLVKVNNEPQLKGRFLRFTADVVLNSYNGKHNPVSGNLLLILPVDTTRPASVNYGDELLIPARYNTVEPPYNPAEFNYKQYLAHQNIYEQAFLTPGQYISLNKNTGNKLIAYALHTRQQLINNLKQYLADTEAVAVASTLILGYKASLSNEILQAYANTGTIHVLSVSGAHVVIIFYLISLMLGFLNRHRYGKLLNVVLSVTLIWAYAVLTGLSPAVCRAAIMISFIITGKAFYQHINTLNILAASAFFMLLLNPFLITDVGFQLSYLAVAGLITFQPIVYNLLNIDNWLLDKLWALCAASIVAQLITFPLSAYYFHQFPVYFLISNLFVLLPSVLIIYIGVTFLLMAQSGLALLAKPIAWLLQIVILFTDNGLQVIEHWPLSTINKIWITPIEGLLLFTLIILLFGTLYYKKLRWLQASLIIILILSLGTSLKNIRAVRSNHVTFFRLKKHPAILFKHGTEGVLLTDLTDTDKTFRYSVRPCIDSNKIEQLTIVPFNKNVSTPYLHKKLLLIRFMGKDFLLLDKLYRVDNNSPPLSVNYLYATDNPSINASQLNHQLNYQLLVVSADNTENTVNKLTDTSANHKKIYSLRRNKALIIPSN